MMQSTAGKETSDPSVLQPPGPVHYAPLLRPSCGSLEDICVACLGSTLEKRKRHDCLTLREGAGDGPAGRACCPLPVRGAAQK